MNLDVVPGPWTSEDLIYELGILRGLPHGNPEQQTRCSACNLWRGNPLKRFQSLLSTARKARPISLLYSVERWNSGRELGCVLCQLVSLAVADTSGSARPPPAPGSSSPWWMAAPTPGEAVRSSRALTSSSSRSSLIRH